MGRSICWTVKQGSALCVLSLCAFENPVLTDKDSHCGLGLVGDRLLFPCPPAVGGSEGEREEADRVPCSWRSAPQSSSDSKKTAVVGNTSHTHCVPQEVGGTFIVEEGLVVMAGAELVEWYQIHHTDGFPCV